MNIILSAAITVCALIVLYSVIDGIISNTRSANYVKRIVMLTLLILIINIFKDFDFSALSFDTTEFLNNTDSVWDMSAQNIENKLTEVFSEFVRSNGLDVENVKVQVDTDYTDFNVKRITISGNDAENAKKLISGHFKIGYAYIFTE